MKDINLALISGNPIPIEECNILLRQPTIKQISFVFLDEIDFFILKDPDLVLDPSLPEEAIIAAVDKLF